MWFNCRCGYRFHDNTDFLPFKGYVLPDEDSDEFSDSFHRYRAIKGETFEDEHKRSDIVLDLWERMRTIYQCPDCGAVYFDDFNSNALHGFVPMAALEGMEEEVNGRLKSIARENDETGKNLLKSHKNFNKN